MKKMKYVYCIVCDDSFKKQVLSVSKIILKTWLVQIQTNTFYIWACSVGVRVRNIITTSRLAFYL